MEKLVQSTELKTDYWQYLDQQKEVKPYLNYDSELDTLFIYFSPGETDLIITHEIDPYISFLYRCEDKEIIGMKIEEFESEFLPAVDEKREWRLSKAGVKLNGLCDFVFTVERETTPDIPKRIEKEIKTLAPVFG